MIDWNSRPNKEHARVYGLAGLGRVQTALMLPGRNCADVRLAMDRGLFDKRTRVDAVERDAAVRRAQARAWPGVDHHTFAGDLVRFVPERDYDLVSLDFCGTMTDPVLDWIGRHRHRFVGRFLLTTAYALRANISLKRRLARLDRDPGFQEFLWNIPRSEQDLHLHGLQYVLMMVLNTSRPPSILTYRDTTPMALYRYDLGA